MSSQQDFKSILDLEQIEHNLYRGFTPQVGWKRVYGGLVIAQSLAAAANTVENKTLHSMHSYFLLGGDPSVPIVYEVDRIRDGSSFATRRVVAIQHGRAIFALSASYHTGEPGYSNQVTMPDVPLPDSLPSEAEMREKIFPQLPPLVRFYYERERPIELKPVHFRRYTEPGTKYDNISLWFRSVNPLPDILSVHQCALAYASDMTLLETSLAPIGKTIISPDMLPASLDHSIWYHRPFSFNDWILYHQDGPTLENGRGFARGMLFNLKGELIASVAQEGLVRIKREN